MNKEIIIAARLNDQDFLEMCILKLYEKQTEDEQSFRSSTHSNRVGFTKADSMYFSEIAEVLLQGESMEYADIGEAARRMRKYAGQLVNYLTEEQIVE